MNDPLVYPGTISTHNTVDQTFAEYYHSTDNRRPLNQRGICFISGPKFLPKVAEYVDKRNIMMYPNMKRNQDWNLAPQIKDMKEFAEALYPGMAGRLLGSTVMFTHVDQATTGDYVFTIKDNHTGHEGAVKLRRFPGIPQPQIDGFITPSAGSYDCWLWDGKDLEDFYSLIMPAIAPDAFSLVILLRETLYYPFPTGDQQCNALSFNTSGTVFLSLAASMPSFHPADGPIRAPQIWPIDIVTFTPAPHPGPNRRNLYEGKTYRQSPIVAAAAAVLPFLRPRLQDQVWAIPESETITRLTDAIENTKIGLEQSDVPLMTEIWLYKIFNLFAHEMAHQLGLDHCTRSCVMEAPLVHPCSAHPNLSPVAPYYCPGCTEKVLHGMYYEQHYPVRLPPGQGGYIPHLGGSRDEIVRLGKTLMFCRIRWKNPQLMAWGEFIDHILSRYQDQAFVIQCLHDVGINYTSIDLETRDLS